MPFGLESPQCVSHHNLETCSLVGAIHEPPPAISLDFRGHSHQR